MIHIAYGSLLSYITTIEDKGTMLCIILFPGMFPPFQEEFLRPQWVLHPVSKLMWGMVTQQDFDLTIGW